MRLRQLEDADFVYGNTRLRARRSALLGPDDHEALLGLDLDGLLGALAETAYRPDVEAALPRFAGIRRVHEAVRTNLARSLRELRAFYRGPARDLVDLMLSSWDLHNLITLLRGLATGMDPDDVVSLIVEVGGLDEASAREVARQPAFAAGVELLEAWRVPTPQDADALHHAWPDFERSGDLAALEHAIAAAHQARRAAALAQAGLEAEPLRAALREEVDDRNLQVVLRVYVSAADPERVARAGAAALPGGAIAPEELVAAAAAPSRGDVAAELVGLAGARRWRQALERWANTGDVAQLQDDLELARVRARVARFGTGDPLGIDIPLAFATAKTTEARNLRELAAGAAAGLDPVLVRARLLIA